MPSCFPWDPSRAFFIFGSICVQGVRHITWPRTSSVVWQASHSQLMLGATMGAWLSGGLAGELGPKKGAMPQNTDWHDVQQWCNSSNRMAWRPECRFRCPICPLVFSFVWSPYAACVWGQVIWRIIAGRGCLPMCLLRSLDARCNAKAMEGTARRLLGVSWLCRMGFEWPP
jgi:hypothetical protein